MNKQNEVLRLADVLENYYLGLGRIDASDAAAELRRLHEENEQLKVKRKPLTAEQVAKLDCHDHYKLARAVEAAHGIKGDA